LRGQGPVPLGGASGNPDDIRVTDDAILAEFPDNGTSTAGITMAQKR